MQPLPTINCPDPLALETGDLLFPRQTRAQWQQEHANPEAAPAHWRAVQASHQRWQRQAGHLTVARALALQATPLQRAALRVLAARLPAQPQAHLLATLQGIAEKDPVLFTLPFDGDGDGGSGGAPDNRGAGDLMPDPDSLEFKLLLLQLLQSQFADIATDWFGMTVAEFIRHPIKQMLEFMLTAGDSGLGFFVGHVALVLREEQGQSVPAPFGSVFVIEASLTDFAHYRVDVSPYLLPEPAPRQAAAGSPVPAWDTGMLRGWANRRCALGEGVWHARLKARPAPGEPLHQWSQSLALHAKRQIGRPYGFFDHPQLGDTDRLYCAEFVHHVLQQLSPALDLRQHCTWDWIDRYFNAHPGSGIEAGLVRQMLAEQPGLRQRPFFVLPPAALWASPLLREVQRPQALGEGYA